MAKTEILIIDDQIQWANHLIRLLRDEYQIYYSSSLNEALTLIDQKPNIQVVITDLVITSYKSHNTSIGYDLIKQIKNRRPNLPIIAYSSFHTGDFTINKDLGIDLFFTRVEISGAGLKKGIEKVIANSVNMQSNKISDNDSILSETRKLIKEELEVFAKTKEKTLSIPGEGNFELIKPLVGFKRDIENQLTKFDYSKNVFLMMKFRDNNKDLSDYIIETLELNGFNGVRADQKEWNITQNVYNPIAVLHCCKFGIALFDEAEDLQAYSPNVAYELGIMHTHDKKCLILRHSSLPTIPFDLIKELYTSYAKDLEVKKILSNWVFQIRLD